MRKNLLALLAIVILETSALAVEKIRMGFPDLAAPFVPLAIADRRGFFQDEGLGGEFI
jgi:ABC-type nitrate/sulfonate/bicarbonate transport system substrate-binding protein